MIVSYSIILINMASMKQQMKAIPILICVALVSCRPSVKESSGVEVIERFSSDVQLAEDSVVLKYPYRIKCANSMLLVWDLHANDHFFHAFTLQGNESRYLFSFGNVGQGPDELLACAGMSVQDDALSILETNRAVLYTYSLNQLKKNIFTPNRIVELPKELIPIFAYTDRGKEGGIVLDSKGENRFFLLNEQGEIEQRLYQLPITSEQTLPTPLLQQLWVSCMDYNPTNNTLAIGTTLGEVLEIYNLKEHSQHILVGGQGEPAFIHQGQQLIMRAANGYQDVLVGKKEIYVLYADITQEEVGEATQQGANTPSGGNKIYVFDLKGVKKKMYVLDRHINGFDIDFEARLIYGVTSNSDCQLCVFEL